MNQSDCEWTCRSYITLVLFQYKNTSVISVSVSRSNGSCGTSLVGSESVWTGSPGRGACRLERRWSGLFTLWQLVVSTQFKGQVRCGFEFFTFSTTLTLILHFLLFLFLACWTVSDIFEPFRLFKIQQMRHPDFGRQTENRKRCWTVVNIVRCWLAGLGWESRWGGEPSKRRGEDLRNDDLCAPVLVSLVRDPDGGQLPWWWSICRARVVTLY